MAEVRFLLDEHVPKAVADALRRRGVDVVTVAERNLLGATDEKLLEAAVADRRAVFTHDPDFLRLHRSSIEHAGIVYASRQLGVGEQVRALTLIHQVLENSDLRGRIEFV